MASSTSASHPQRSWSRSPVPEAIDTLHTARPKHRSVRYSPMLIQVRVARHASGRAPRSQRSRAAG